MPSDLEKRAATVFAWVPGMKLAGADAWIIAIDTPRGALISRREDYPNPYKPQRQWAALDSTDVPDIDDPGNLGHMLAQVREAHDDPYADLDSGYVDGVRVWSVWRAHSDNEDVHELGWGLTEAEALIAAMEAAT